MLILTVFIFCDSMTFMTSIFVGFAWLLPPVGMSSHHTGAKIHLIQAWLSLTCISYDAISEGAR